MKKYGLAILGVIIASSFTLSAQAIDLNSLKSSALNANNASASASKKDEKQAANEAYKKQYQARIEAQKKALDAVNAYDRQAKLELAGVILDKEQLAEIKKLTGEELDKKLNDDLVERLKSEMFTVDFAEYTDAQKKAYEEAVKKLQIADNRYKNVSNQLTAPIKQIVDGKVGALSAKEELKNAAGMILGIKKDLGNNGDILKAVNKINKANNIVIVVPENERVIYPSDGTIGSINAQLESINNGVYKASKVIADIYITKEQKAELAAIQNNQTLSKEERDAAVKKAAYEFAEQNEADGTINAAMQKLTPAQLEAYKKASGELLAAGASYGAIALACTKLGFNISKNPLIAAPLALELGAIKDTASLAKNGASSLAKSAAQIKRINKANGITIEKPKKATDDAKAGALGKLKSLKK